MQTRLYLTHKKIITLILFFLSNTYGTTLNEIISDIDQRTISSNAGVVCYVASMLSNPEIYLSARRYGSGDDTSYHAELCVKTPDDNRHPYDDPRNPIESFIHDDDARILFDYMIRMYETNLARVTQENL